MKKIIFVILIVCLLFSCAGRKSSYTLNEITSLLETKYGTPDYVSMNSYSYGRKSVFLTWDKKDKKIKVFLSSTGTSNRFYIFSEDCIYTNNGYGAFKETLD